MTYITNHVHIHLYIFYLWEEDVTFQYVLKRGFPFNMFDGTFLDTQCVHVMTLYNVCTRRGLTLSDVRLKTQMKNQSIIRERNECVEILNITFIMTHYFQFVLMHTGA